MATEEDLAGARIAGKKSKNPLKGFFDRIKYVENIKDKIKNSSRETKKEVREKISGYILAAFGLVAALAWNEAIKGLIEYFFPISKNTVLAKFIYAIVLTFIVVIVSIYLTRLLSNKKEEK